MKSKTLWISLLSLLLTSCSGYRGQWDCRPAKGVPCTSVTDIEAMIIESDVGPNIFLGSESDQKPDQTQKMSNDCVNSLHPKVYRVWIAPKSDATGKCNQGFYMELNPECEKC